MCCPEMAAGLVLNGDDRKDVPSRAARYRVFALVGCGIAVQYWIRASISVAVTLAPERYDWRGPWAALSLSAFFVGYMPCQVPWSRLASRISPRSALASSVAISSAATLAVGCSLRSGAAVCAFRVATGFAQAATFPCTYALVNQWAEPAEISRAIGVAKSIGENGGALLDLPRAREFGPGAVLRRVEHARDRARHRGAHRRGGAQHRAVQPRLGEG